MISKRNAYYGKPSPEQITDPNHITEYENLYPWLLCILRDEGEEKRFSKALVDWCEVVLNYPMAAPDQLAKEFDVTDLLADAFMRSVDSAKVYLMSTSLVEFACIMYSAPVDKEVDHWEDTYDAAASVMQIEGNKHFFRFRNNGERMIGTKRLKRQYGITVEIPVDC